MVRLGLDESHLAGKTEFVDHGPDLGQFRVAFRAGGAADDQQDRVLAVQFRKRLHRHVDTLQRLDTADEQQDRAVTQRQRMTGTALVTWCEERVLHAGRDDLDVPGRGAVQLGELPLLLGARHTDRVAAPDDVGLGLLALGALGHRRVDDGVRAKEVAFASPRRSAPGEERRISSLSASTRSGKSTCGEERPGKSSARAPMTRSSSTPR